MSNEQIIIEKLEAIQKENQELKQLVVQVIEKQNEPFIVRLPAVPVTKKLQYDED